MGHGPGCALCALCARLLEEGGRGFEVGVGKRSVALALAVEHISLAGFHVLEVALPLARAVCRLGEHGEFGLALDEVAVLCVVEIVGKGRADGEIHHRRESYRVPSVLDGDGSVAAGRDGISGDFHDGVLRYLDAVALLHVDGEFSLRICSPVGDPHAVVIELREVLVLVGDHVSVLPGELFQEGGGVAIVVAVDIERHPVPPRHEFDGLDILRTSLQYDGFLGGALEGLRLEFDGLGGGKQHHLARVVVPELEVEGALHGHAVIDTEIDEALAGRGLVVDIAASHASSGGIEYAHDVAGVGDDVLTYLHASYNTHGELLYAWIDVPQGFVALHGDVQHQRLRQPVLVGEIDDVVVSPHVRVLVDGEGQRLLALGIDDILQGVDGEPLRHILDGEGVRCTAVIVNVDVEAHVAVGQ